MIAFNFPRLESFSLLGGTDWSSHSRWTDHEALLIASVVLIATVVCFYAKIYPQLHKEAAEPAASRVDFSWKAGGALDPNRNRVHGDWTPVEFAYPPISPCPHELSDIKPIPYRPFRWGKYQSMPWDDWIELDNQYESYWRIRAHRIKTRGTGVIRVFPDQPGLVRSGAEAAIELVHELAEYLSRRYPTTFRVLRYPSSNSLSCAGWDGTATIKTITVVPLGVTHELPLQTSLHNDGETPGNGGEDFKAAEKALEIAALLVQDDLALMVEGTDGRYYFQAGAICVAGFWRMEDKIGLPLDEIHLTGDVPHYESKLQLSMERFFRRLPVDKPVVRNNYFVQVVKPVSDLTDGDHLDPEELAWSASTNGPEDAFVRAHRAHLALQSPPTPDMLRMRSERQTLRRLPRSGAIVFTIRTYLTPLEQLGREQGVPGRLASAMKGWDTEVAGYKGREGGGWWEVMLGYLERCWEVQVQSGESEERKGDKYPF